MMIYVYLIRSGTCATTHTLSVSGQQPVPRACCFELSAVLMISNFSMRLEINDLFMHCLKDGLL